MVTIVNQRLVFDNAKFDGNKAQNINHYIHSCIRVFRLFTHAKFKVLHKYINNVSQATFIGLKKQGKFMIVVTPSRFMRVFINEVITIKKL